MSTHADVLILGGGSAGYSCALRASQLGRSVTLIEADQVGGTCLHRGCIPTKALLHAAEVADTARGAEGFGVRANVTGIDMPTVHAYKDSVVGRLYTGLQGLIANRNVNVVRGTGHYAGDRTVNVDGTAYTGSAVVLATGSTPRVIPGIEIGGRIVSSDEALRLPEVPTTAIVLGGGVIGVEFASIWASFGTQVTVVEALPRLVAGEDPWASKALEKAFRKRGITVMTSTRVTGASQNSDAVSVEIDGDATLTADVVLVAVGRTPNSAGFGEAGIDVDRGYVCVDDRLSTNHDGVYAVGDLVPGPQLAHRGFAHGMFVADQIAGLRPTPVTDALIPRVTHSTPAVASVGLNEAAAREAHDEITTLVYDLAGNGKSQILRTSGGIKVILAGRNGPVVGVHMVGDRIGELIGEAQLMVGWEALPSDVAPLLHAHPSQNEALGEAMLALAGTPLHAHS
ncbi:dihydrolipoamide dehydrogenase [Mycobacterium frederiksbergense]|uniref:Dihydrolipoyl dehydrogenase n=1 Tax=Mycolicibacterium frederiksbergense TaxID=117567 RepID=A0ABT6KVS0_9MYCO|nr:dihydrolipoyl dehydrogenase [Mycolicibacterium frederiksbergense]MDH6194813.1 dihydrolipoamide dehydrogenase [Mycolicibacterium frederiksbergense]